jgi:hypothetical protein
MGHHRLMEGKERRCHDGSISCCGSDRGRMAQRPRVAVALTLYKRRCFCSTKKTAKAHSMDVYAFGHDECRPQERQR